MDWCLPVGDEISRSLSFARRPGLRMTPSVFIIMGTDSTVKYIHRGEMREAEITAVLELIDSLIAEAKAAATSP